MALRIPDMTVKLSPRKSTGFSGTSSIELESMRNSWLYIGKTIMTTIYYHGGAATSILSAFDVCDEITGKSGIPVGSTGI